LRPWVSTTCGANDDKALQEFQKAIDLNPNHLDALYNLGGLLKDSGR
jgi:tetratricopeptide (TPR) repeat protein